MILANLRYVNAEEKKKKSGSSRNVELRKSIAKKPAQNNNSTGITNSLNLSRECLLCSKVNNGMSGLSKSVFGPIMNDLTSIVWEMRLVYYVLSRDVLVDIETRRVT